MALEPKAGSETGARAAERSGLRYFLMALGWLFVAIGVAGIFLPLVPTTPLLLVALWCFSRSSKRFHDWLYGHPRLGPPLREWREHRVITPRAKALTVAVMAASLLYVSAYVADSWLLPTGLAAVLLPPAVFVLTRPSRRRPSGLTR